MIADDNSFTRFVGFFVLWVTVLAFTTGEANADRLRARDLGIPFNGTPGKYNAITDVLGVEVGYSTIIKGNGRLVVGEGPVRTGVTAIFPRGKKGTKRVFAGTFVLNGIGEMTGRALIAENGFLAGPVIITNTTSIGVAVSSVVEWYTERYKAGEITEDEVVRLPTVAETSDGFLNDTLGFHIKKQHVFEAMNTAAGGKIQEGNVGGGTGTVAHYFKGGTGTASRVLEKEFGGYTVGVLVQANYGNREQLMIAGVPVGKEITDLLKTSGPKEDGPSKDGSLIVVIGTNAPLTALQLQAVARRGVMGHARLGAISGKTSGDIYLAFSTAEFEESAESISFTNMHPLTLSPVFIATVQATEEAIVNALVAAETMTGINGNTVYALPHDRLQEVMHKYNRLIQR